MTTMREVLESMDPHDRKYYQDEMYRKMCDRVDQLSLALTRIAAETNDQNVKNIAYEALDGVY